MGGRVWTLTQTDDTLWYHVYKPQDRQVEGGDRKRKAGVSLKMEKKSSEKRLKEGVVKKEEEEPVAVTSVQDAEEEEEMLRDYFRLDVNMGDLYREWGAADPHFQRIADIFTGQCVVVACVIITCNTVRSDCANINHLKYNDWSLPRCANAAPGPHRMPFFYHLHLQQQHPSYPRHGGEAVSGSGHPTVPTG